MHRIGGVLAAKPAGMQALASTSSTKAPEDGRFREAMAGETVASPKVSVGRTPVVIVDGRMVPEKPGAAVKPQPAAPVAVKEKPRQDTGAVVVAKKESRQKKDEAGATQEQDAPAAADAEAAVTQQSSQPAPATAPEIPVVVSVAPAVGQDGAPAVSAKDFKDAPPAATVAGKKVETKAGVASAKISDPAPGPAKPENVAEAVANVAHAAEHVPAVVTNQTVPVSEPLTHGPHALRETTGIAAKSSETAVVSQHAVDLAPPVSDIQTLVATPNVLEVGVASGTHGWLRVRAELDPAGEVTASVAAATNSAAEGLHKELPAISAYLDGERVHVNSLVVHAAGGTAGVQDAALKHSGAGTQGQRQEQPQGALARNPAASVEDDSGGTSMLDLALSRVSLPAAVYANGSGSWLSVRV